MKKSIVFSLVLIVVLGTNFYIAARTEDEEDFGIVTEVIHPISLSTAPINFDPIYEPGTYSASAQFVVEGTPDERYVLEIEGEENRATVILSTDSGNTMEVELDYPNNPKIERDGIHRFFVEAELDLTELPPGGVYSKDDVTATVTYDY